MTTPRETKQARAKRVRAENRLRRAATELDAHLIRVRRYTDLAPDRGLYRLTTTGREGPEPVIVCESFRLSDIEECLLQRAADRRAGKDT